MNNEFLENLKPLLPVLTTAKRIFFDRPVDLTQSTTADIKKERASFIQENPQGSTSAASQINSSSIVYQPEIDRDYDQDYDQYSEEDDEVESDLISEKTHLHYKSIISMYHQQSIEMAKLLDSLQHQLYNIQLDLCKKYAGATRPL